MTRQPGGTAASADPGDVARAREAAAWSPEELADALGVLPLEVAAWESGAIRLTPHHEMDVLRWRIATALHEARLPPLSSPCEWTSRNRDRLEQSLRAGGRPAARARDARRRHHEQCDVCRAAGELAAAGPAPVPPIAPGWRGWAHHVGRAVSAWPDWARIPATSAFAGLAAGGVVVAAYLLELLREGSEAEAFRAAGTLALVSLTAWSTLVFRLLRPLGARAPVRAGQICAAMIVLPAAFAWSRYQDVAMVPGMWFIVCVVSALAGSFLAGVYGEEDEFD